MHTSRNLLIGAMALVALAACGSDEADTPTTSATAATSATTSAPNPTTTPAAAAGASQLAGPATVSIGNFTFEPATVSVAVGATVTWTNDNAQPHTATSAGNFDTDSIAPGASSAAITFDRAGSYSYVCAFHPFMTGTVVVA